MALSKQHSTWQAFATPAQAKQAPPLAWTDCGGQQPPSVDNGEWSLTYAQGQASQGTSMKLTCLAGYTPSMHGAKITCVSDNPFDVNPASSWSEDPVGSLGAICTNLH